MKNFDSMTLQRTFETMKDALAFVAEQTDKSPEGMELASTSIRRFPIYEKQSDEDFNAMKPAKILGARFQVNVSFSSPYGEMDELYD